MKNSFPSKHTKIALVIASLGFTQTTWATPINLVMYPAGTAYKAPIPNVILSIDTSGSMAFCDKADGTVANSTSNSCPTSRLSYVKSGLKSLLIDKTTYDNQFRLAWQSFACNDIPSTNGNCNGNNSIGKFSGTQKTNFTTWLNALTATGSTPSQVLAWSAGKYLQTTGNNSPWNATPGTADNSQLSCRRAYHIFLTDGGWNFTYESSAVDNTKYQNDMYLGQQVSNSSTAPSITNTSTIANYDGKSITALPSGSQNYTITNPATAPTQIYQDAYGARVINTSSSSGSGSNKKYTYNYYAYPTLADISFYFWATDLQPSIGNNLIPKIRKTGDETFSSGNRNSTYSEYWNPKNDPAEWQHLVQYTIGYGNTASTLSQVTNTSPQWSGGTFGMYDAGFSSLAVGNTKWDDVTSTTADSSNATGGYDKVRPQELWHMAINSRGKYYPVSGDLTAVFADIFDDIVVDTTAPITGFTSASGSVSRVGTQSYQTSYIAADDANSNDNRWYGYVTSDYINTSGTSAMNPDWGVNTSNNRALSTADKLDALNATQISSRLIFSYNKLSSPAGGISFKWANLSSSPTNDVITATQRMWMNKGTAGAATTIAGDGRGEDRVNFIRGDRTKESSNYSTSNTTANFRNRKSRQGDIVNSAIWYVGSPANGYTSNSYQTFINTNRYRLPMLYVGGNDGMLHGFSAKDGTEKIGRIQT